MELPSISCYCPGTKEINALCLYFPSIAIWYSYRTIIAYKRSGECLVIRENDWSTTTGKHLNAINADKSIRIDGRQFESQLQEAFSL